MKSDKPSRSQRLLLALATCAVLATAAAAGAYAQGSTAVFGEGGPRDQNRGGRPKAGAPAAPDEGELTPKLRPQPTQRLEPGALLCKTEADLQQHEAAVNARLNGGDAAEPAGCHLVRTMTAVSVVDRHGPGRTQVKAGNQLGWTDALIRNP